MGYNIKFEFDCDEVFEGIKAGVIKELSESSYDEIRSKAVNEIKNKIVSEINLDYSELRKLKDDVMADIQNKIHKEIITEVKQGQMAKIQQLADSALLSEKGFMRDLSDKIVIGASNTLYENLKWSIEQDVKSKVNAFIHKLTSSIADTQVKVSGSKKTITKKEYEELVERSEKLEALEQGGVDNWTWYEDSLRQYFGNDEQED